MVYHFVQDYPDIGLDEEGATSRGPILRSESESAAEGYVSSIKNATQNVVGRISVLGRGVGGFANKFSGGFLNF